MDARTVRMGVGSATLMALAVLAGCGFHLQRPATLPESLKAVHVVAEDTQSDFYHALRLQLEQAGADPDARTSGAAVLRILGDGTSERVLSVSARNVPTEYELRYAVRVAVDAGGRELLPAEEFSLTRDYSFDETTLLAKERERDMLSAALASELAFVVVSRLASLE